MADFFLAVLRWVAKDDRGCTKPYAVNYNPLATVPWGCDIPIGARREGPPIARVKVLPGRRSAGGVSLDITVEGADGHSVVVTTSAGREVFRTRGQGHRAYRIQDLPPGLYLAQVQAAGRAIRKPVVLP
jgi:hypothetical protein